MRSVCCTVALNTGAATSPPKYLPALGSSIITADDDARLLDRRDADEPRRGTCSSA